jgi:hypothetical protein
VRPIKRIALFSLLLMVLLLLTLFPVRSNADVFKWVDEEGVVHFTDDIDEVPLKYRPEVITKQPTSKKPEISSDDKDWAGLTSEEKAEYLRRLKAKKDERDRKIAGYPERIQQLIRDHKLEVGMTKEMVLLSWGNPVDTRPRTPRNPHERWIYSTQEPEKYACAYFENDILAKWDE